MAVFKVEVRRGAYYDSIMLMELQAALAALPGVRQAGVVMGTRVNRELLHQRGLLPPEIPARPEDLIISIEGVDEDAAAAALGRVDDLLARRPTTLQQDYRPRSLEAAARTLPEARWVLVSVPGRYAAGVAREALRLGKHVFLYSDNVALEDEVALKREAAEQGLLLMGPDCGTALIHGVGLGFANRVRRGPVGLVGASGTGLQAVTARIHEHGSGITHALGTGGRDLHRAVGGITARQALDLLRRDPETRVIVLLSKPPDPAVAAPLLALARQAGKPVVVHFMGYAPPTGGADADNLCVAATLDEAADLAVERAEAAAAHPVDGAAPRDAFAPGPRYVRGLFSGGTLAYESLRILQTYLPIIYANIAEDPEYRLDDPHLSRGHTVLDLGDDAFTVGRLHPMLDGTLRLERLAREAADPSVAVILLDVVLGYGAHADPAAALAPGIAAALERAAKAGRRLDVVVVVVGTDEDPQDLAAQVERFEAAGARVERSVRAAAAWVGRRVQALGEADALPPVDPAALQAPFGALNVGLESFAASLAAQGASVLHVDWRPPAGGDERLMAILERLTTPRPNAP